MNHNKEWRCSGLLLCVTAVLALMGCQSETVAATASQQSVAASQPEPDGASASATGPRSKQSRHVPR